MPSPSSHFLLKMGKSNQKTPKKGGKKDPSKAPHKVPKKNKKTKKVATADGPKNYTVDEMYTIGLLACEHLPLGCRCWQYKIEPSFNAIHPVPGRAWQSLRTKFNAIKRERPPTGDPHCPEHIKLVKQASQMILAKSHASDGGSPVGSVASSDDEDEDEDEDDEDENEDDDDISIASSYAYDSSSDSDDDLTEILQVQEDIKLARKLYEQSLANKVEGQRKRDEVFEKLLDEEAHDKDDTTLESPRRDPHDMTALLAGQEQAQTEVAALKSDDSERKEKGKDDSERKEKRKDKKMKKKKKKSSSSSSSMSVYETKEPYNVEKAILKSMKLQMQASWQENLRRERQAELDRELEKQRIEREREDRQQEREDRQQQFQLQLQALQQQQQMMMMLFKKDSDK